LPIEEEKTKEGKRRFSAFFLLEKKSEKEAKRNSNAGRRKNKLLDEVESWRSFAQALRIEDRRLLNSMLEKIWEFESAVESCKEGYETEAFLLGLLILQQKTIDYLEGLVAAAKKKATA